MLCAPWSRGRPGGRRVPAACVSTFPTSSPPPPPLLLHPVSSRLPLPLVLLALFQELSLHAFICCDAPANRGMLCTHKCRAELPFGNVSPTSADRFAHHFFADTHCSVRPLHPLPSAFLCQPLTSVWRHPCRLGVCWGAGEAPIRPPPPPSPTIASCRCHRPHRQWQVPRLPLMSLVNLGARRRRALTGTSLPPASLERANRRWSLPLPRCTVDLVGNQLEGVLAGMEAALVEAAATEETARVHALPV